MKARLCIDDAVGETRRCLTGMDGRAFRLEVERWSTRDKRAKLDEIRWGRATARTPGGAGWFVDLGLDRAGVLETKAAITEGAMIAVRVKAEAFGDKGCALSLADMKADAARPDRPGLHAVPVDDPFLRGVEIVETISGAEARSACDAAIEEALGVVVPLPGGGDIAIEATRALTAIDVDAGNRSGAGEAFARDTNLAAAQEAARQVSLRSIGGLVVIDFLSMAARDRRGVTGAFRDGLAASLGRASEISEISALGLCEAAIARRARPVAEALGGGAERAALDVLRAIESCGWSARGGRIFARVAPEVAAWLEADAIGWKDTLAARIGARWVIETGAAAAPSQVWSA